MFPKGFPTAEDKTQPESKTNPRSMEDEVILNFFPKTPLGPTAHNSPLCHILQLWKLSPEVGFWKNTCIYYYIIYIVYIYIVYIYIIYIYIYNMLFRSSSDLCPLLRKLLSLYESQVPSLTYPCPHDMLWQWRRTAFQTGNVQQNATGIENFIPHSFLKRTLIFTIGLLQQTPMFEIRVC